MLSDKNLTEVFAKTKGHCHFCGDRLSLAKYADPEASRGAWEIDHIVQKAKGGLKDISNCLPACVKCNRLRWHRSGKDVRDLILFGLIAKDEIKRKTEVGQRMLELKRKRLTANRKRRRTIGKGRTRPTA